MTPDEKITTLEQRLAVLEKAKAQKRWLYVAAAVALPTLLFAAAITKPHTFSDGDTLSAAKLNENFDTLYAKVNELDAWKTAEEAKGKSWRLIYENDAATSTTSVNVTGLNGDTDINYKIVARFANPAAGNCSFYLKPNNDNTASYGFQEAGANGGALSAARLTGQNTGMLLGDANSGTGATQAVYEGMLVAKSGAWRPLVGVASRQVNADLVSIAEVLNSMWNNTASNITSLMFTSNCANGIGAGSHIEIWARR